MVTLLSWVNLWTNIKFLWIRDTCNVSFNIREHDGEKRVVEPMWAICKPVPSPRTTSSCPSYSEWIERLAKLEVMLWEAAESRSHLLFVEVAQFVAGRDYSLAYVLAVCPDWSQIWQTTWDFCDPNLLLLEFCLDRDLLFLNRLLDNFLWDEFVVTTRAEALLSIRLM